MTTALFYTQAARVRRVRYGGFGFDVGAVASAASGALSSGDPAAVLDPLVSKIVFDSQLLPQISINRPFAPSGSGDSATIGTDANEDFGDKVVRWLKPKVTVFTPNGSYSVSPAGEPHDPSYWPFVEVGLLLAGVLAAYGGYHLARELIK